MKKALYIFIAILGIFVPIIGRTIGKALEFKGDEWFIIGFSDLIALLVIYFPVLIYFHELPKTKAP